MPTPVSLSDLVVDASGLDARALLAEWRWLVGAHCTPVFVTALGDAFLHDGRDGSVHLLSVGEGTLEPIAATLAAFEERLRDHAFVHAALVPGVVAKLRAATRPLQVGEVYGYRMPPRLGGAYDVGNLEPTDVVAYFARMGRTYAAGPNDSGQAH